jgi:macrolide-specific efflux system membrane fusion protein
MKKTLIVLALIAASYGAWRWWDGRQAAQAPAYGEAVVELGDLKQSVQATGTVQPMNRLELRPPLAGRVESVLVREGDRVKRGQVLAWLSSNERAALLDAARAQGPEQVKRWEELYKATPVLASIGGEVIARLAEPGQTVGAGDTLLVLSDRLIVMAQVDETDIARVRRGQAAEFRLDAYGDDVVEARVGHIAYEARTVSNVTMYDVELLPRQVPGFMRSGMTANVDFILQRREGVPVLPLDALKRSRRGAWVLLPGAKGSAQPVSRSVKLGLEDGRNAEIVEGLAVGDTVLIDQSGLPQAQQRGSSPLQMARPGGRR